MQHQTSTLPPSLTNASEAPCCRTAAYSTIKNAVRSCYPFSGWLSAWRARCKIRDVQHMRRRPPRRWA